MSGATPTRSPAEVMELSQSPIGCCEAAIVYMDGCKAQRSNKDGYPVVEVRNILTPAAGEKKQALVAEVNASICDPDKHNPVCFCLCFRATDSLDSIPTGSLLHMQVRADARSLGAKVHVVKAKVPLRVHDPFCSRSRYGFCKAMRGRKTRKIEVDRGGAWGTTACYILRGYSRSILAISSRFTRDGRAIGCPWK